MAKAETMTIAGLGITMVKIPKGSFMMGNPAAKKGNDEGPAHQVTLTKDFWMGATCVTVGQWRHFVETTGYVTEAEHGNIGIFVKRDDPGPKRYLNWRNPGIPRYNQTEEGPVLGISWRDIQQFLTWLNEREGAHGRLPAGYVYRLPTEAQWEYAARAGTATPWWTGAGKHALEGTCNIADRAAKRGGANWPGIDDWPELDDGFAVHAAVTRYRPNPFGLHNMHGNVWEWCRDEYGTYSLEVRPGTGERLGGSPIFRMSRGGSFYHPASASRSANRNNSAPETRSNHLGLRPARAITGP